MRLTKAVALGRLIRRKVRARNERYCFQLMRVWNNPAKAESLLAPVFHGAGS